MKIASLFAELGFKVEGSDLDTLRTFETTLNNIANAADRAAAALRTLGGIKIKVPTVTEQKPKPPGKSGWVFNGGPFGFVTPKLPPGSPPTPPTPPTPPAPLPPSGMLPANRFPQNPPLPPRQPPPPPPPPTFGSQVFAGLQRAFPFLKTALQLGLVGTAALLLAKAATSAARAIMDMTKAAFDNSVETEKLTTVTGLSRQELKSFELFAAKSGISADVMTDAVKQFQSEATKIRYGEGDPSGFGFLGISPFQPVAQILQDFVEKTKGLSEQEARFRAQRIGINDELFSALRRYGPELTKSLDQTLLVSDRQQQKTRDAARALSQLGFSSRLAFEALASELAPVVTFVAEVFTKLINVFTRFINLFESIPDPFEAGQKAGTDLREFFKNLLPDDSGKSAMNRVMVSPTVLPPSVQVMSGRPNVTQNVDITVEGSQSPAQTGNSIKRSLERSISDAYNQSPAYQGLTY